MQRKRISQSLPSLLVLLTLIGCISITDAKTVNGVMTTADSKLYSGQYIASFCFHGEYLLNRTIEQKEDRERGSVKPGRAGPCPTTAIWRCHNNSSQWQHSFQWKLRSHWLKFLWQHRRSSKTGPRAGYSEHLCSWNHPGSVKPVPRLTQFSDDAGPMALSHLIHLTVTL